MDIELRKKAVGEALERFLDGGMTSLREAMERAYERGHQEGFGWGCRADQETKDGLRKSVDLHMKKWQDDRQALMPMIPGYKYQNRVDDPEWDKAVLQIKALLCKAEIAEMERKP